MNQLQVLQWNLPGWTQRAVYLHPTDLARFRNALSTGLLLAGSADRRSKRIAPFYKNGWGRQTFICHDYLACVGGLLKLFQEQIN